MYIARSKDGGLLLYIFLQCGRDKHWLSKTHNTHFHAVSSSALLSDGHMNLIFPGIFHMPCLMKHLLKLKSFLFMQAHMHAHEHVRDLHLHLVIIHDTTKVQFHGE